MSIRTILTLALALVVVPMPALAFHEEGIPVLFATSGSGSGAYGVAFEHEGGSFAIDLYGNGPQSAQSVSVAAFIFDSNKNLVFGFAFTGHSSPDRLILSPAGVSGNAELIPDWLDVGASTWDSSTDAACTFACMGLSSPGAPAGTYYYLLWASGVSSTTLEVRAAGGDVTVTNGPAYSIGDAEIANGDVNAQVGVEGAGVKLMRGASASVDVDNKLWGFWGNSDFKLACQFAAGACLWRSSITYTCYANGLDCDTTQISHSGPAGSGVGFAAFLGTTPGAYTFTVDEKTDFYAPAFYDPATGTFVLMGEDYTYLTAADVDLP